MSFSYHSSDTGPASPRSMQSSTNPHSLRSTRSSNLRSPRFIPIPQSPRTTVSTSSSSKPLPETPRTSLSPTTPRTPMTLSALSKILATPPASPSLAALTPKQSPTLTSAATTHLTALHWPPSYTSYPRDTNFTISLPPWYAAHYSYTSPVDACLEEGQLTWDAPIPLCMPDGVVVEVTLGTLVLGWYWSERMKVPRTAWEGSMKRAERERWVGKGRAWMYGQERAIPVEYKGDEKGDEEGNAEEKSAEKEAGDGEKGPEEGKTKEKGIETATDKEGGDEFAAKLREYLQIVTAEGERTGIWARAPEKDSGQESSRRAKVWMSDGHEQWEFLDAETIGEPDAAESEWI